MARRGPKEMTPEHKAAMELGRAESRVVSEYLDALRSNKPKRGRKRTPESIRMRLEAIDEQIDEASVIEELQMVQERRNLKAELEAMATTVDISEFENKFIGVAKAYGERKGISYAAWREVGVSVDVLRRAGITFRS